MRSFLPAMKLCSLHTARSAAQLALVAALLSGCGGASADAKSPSPPGDDGGLPPPPPPEEGGLSFMRIGPFEQPSVATAAAPAPTATGTSLPAEPPRPVTLAARLPADETDVGLKSTGGPEKKSVEGAVVESQGGLSEADVRAAIAGKQASFRRCYELGVSSAPDFAGRVTLRVSISPAGNVASVEVISTDTKVPSVDTCVRDEIRTLMFKATGMGAVVAFPIEFGR